MNIDIVSAKLNSEGLYLTVVCDTEVLGLDEILLARNGMSFRIVELNYKDSDDEIYYTIVRKNPDVYKDFEISKWVSRYLTREDV